MDQDEFGEVINGENTYREICKRLRKGQSVIIGWTDKGGTHLDILFTFQPYKVDNNMLQRGLRDWYLYVSVIGIGAFGFNSDSAKTPGYVSQKIGLYGETVDKFTELINGIIDTRRFYKEVED